MTHQHKTDLLIIDAVPCGLAIAIAAQAYHLDHLMVGP